MNRGVRWSLWLLALSAPLAAQEPRPSPPPADTGRPAPSAPRRGWAFAVMGQTGGEWDPSAMELAIVQAVGGRPAHNLYLGARLGAWTSEQGFVREGTRGLFLGLVGGYHRRLVTLLELGASQRDTSYAWLTGTLESSINADFRSPTPDRAHATVAFLVGVYYGAEAPVARAFGLLMGPSAYLGGRTSDLRLQIGMRVQAPFRRRR